MEGARDAWEGMPLPPLRGDGHLVNFDDVFACAGGMGAPVRVHFTLACTGFPHSRRAASAVSGGRVPFAAPT